MNTPSSRLELRKAMRKCEQMPGMSVLEHGMMVARYFEDLRSHILNGTPLAYEWNLPEWAYQHVLWDTLLDLRTVRRYQIMHDCGKPWAKTVDADGKVHFPDHAAVSASLWASLGGSKQETALIAMDMDIHVLKDEGVSEFASRPEASTLLLTGLAELHANASMFGGVDSVSFKIKFKQLNRRGKAITALLQSTHSIKNHEVHYA